MSERPDARRLLTELTGRTIHTLTGKPNKILAIRSDTVLVATSRSPHGQPVPIAWVEDALARLYEDRELEISVPSVGYRSAFIGAVLATLPGTKAEAPPPDTSRRRFP